MKDNIATCIGCGCTDMNACWDDDKGARCHWLAVDRAAGLGVCSACPELLDAWNAGNRTVRVPVDVRPNDVHECEYEHGDERCRDCANFAAGARIFAQAKK